jgi:NADH pyrophosphatase NudC (nudix superfamily)
MSGSNPHFTQWYSCVVDKSLNEFTIQVEEVAEIRWFTETDFPKKFPGTCRRALYWGTSHRVDSFGHKHTASKREGRPVYPNVL